MGGGAAGGGVRPPGALRQARDEVRGGPVEAGHLDILDHLHAAARDAVEFIDVPDVPEPTGLAVEADGIGGGVDAEQPDALAAGGVGDQRFQHPAMALPLPVGGDGNQAHRADVEQPVEPDHADR